jgi:predicted Zn finger-like uncharacterized protein
MILTCPNCGTQYAVKDGAIPHQGRQVRCAACKHSWHQDPEGGAQHQAEPEAEPEPAPPVDSQADEEWREESGDETVAEATLIEPRSGPEAEQRAYEEALVEAEQGEPVPPAPAEPAIDHEQTAVVDAPGSSDWNAPPQPEAQQDDFSPFADNEDEYEPERRSRVWPLLLVLLLIAATAAAFWFLAPPEWKAQLGLADGATSPLALVTTHMDRQRLESGDELLTVSGRVINPTAQDQSVPPLQAQLRDRTGTVVYSWTIAPPARTLPPGASASFNSAERNIPAGGEELTITVGAPKA